MDITSSAFMKNICDLIPIEYAGQDVYLYWTTVCVRYHCIWDIRKLNWYTWGGVLAHAERSDIFLKSGPSGWPIRM